MSFSHNADRSDVTESGYVSGIVTVSTTQVEAKVGATALANRQVLSIQNRSTRSVYYGPTGVTTTTGFEILKNQTLFLADGPNQPVYLIASTGSNDINVQERA